MCEVEKCSLKKPCKNPLSTLAINYFTDDKDGIVTSNIIDYLNVFDKNKEVEHVQAAPACEKFLGRLNVRSLTSCSANTLP